MFISKQTTSRTSGTAYILGASSQAVREPVYLYQDVVYTPMQSSDAPKISFACYGTNTHLLALSGTCEIYSALATFQCTKYDIKQSTSPQ